jgi:hypothetical protein
MRGTLNNFRMVLKSFGILFGVCLAKFIFIKKQNNQNKSKGVFSKQPLRPKTLPQKY